MAKTTNETAAKTAKAGKTAGAAQEAKDEITLDRRGTGERRSEDAAGNAKRGDNERRKAPRRRQIDPTTCERDYSEAEIEFMQAMDDYKRANGRMFPTCSEILEVLQGLGYQKVATVEDDQAQAAEATSPETTEPTKAAPIVALDGDNLAIDQPPANAEV